MKYNKVSNGSKSTRGGAKCAEATKKTIDIDIDMDKLTKLHVGPVLSISDGCTIAGDVKASNSVSYNIKMYLCPTKGTF